MDKKEKDYLLKEFSETTEQDWLKEALSSLKGKTAESLNSMTYEGIEIKPIYFTEPLDVPEGYPGIPPFTRGSESGMYKIKVWDICQEINEPDPEKFNQYLTEDLSKGQTAIYIRILDSTSSKIDNEGTIINNANDFQKALKGIDLNKFPISVSFDSNSFGTFELLKEHLYSQKNLTEMKLYIDFDPITEIIKNSGFRFDLEEVINQFEKEVKEFNSIFHNSKLIGINSYIYAEKGSNAVQELAFAFSTALEFIYRFHEAGFEIDEICQNLYFNISVGNDFFMEIAKFRAAREIWSKLIQKLSGNENSQKMHVRAINTLWNKSTLDKHTNILRGTSEAISAILGGCKAITIRPFDLNTSENHEFSRRVARNTQLVLQNECNLTETIDPAGGSYYIEYLTTEIKSKVIELMKKIESKKGIIESIKKGMIQDEIAETCYKRSINFKTRKDVLIGINKYPNSKDILLDHASYKNELSSEDNVLVPFKLSDELKNIKPFIDFKPDKDIIELRTRVIEHKKKNNISPSVQIIAFGEAKQFKARVDFTKEFFATAGIDAIFDKPFSDINSAIDSLKKPESNIIVICSDDDTYKSIVDEFALAAKNENTDLFLILAGYPKEHIEAYRYAGIDMFIHVKADIVESLNQVLSISGVK